MAKNLKPVAQTDFSGGVNLVVNPYLISQKQAADVQNMWLDEHGSLRTRDGVRTLTTSPDTTNPIYYRGILTKVNGQNFPFAIQTGDAGSAIAVDTSGSTTFGGTTCTLSYTCGASATVLIVSLHFTGSATVDSVTYDGKNLTRIISVGNGEDSHVELWGIFGPTTGSAKNIVAKTAAGETGRLHARSYTNATGWGSPASLTGDVNDPISLTLASATNHLVIDALTSDTTGVVTAGQTSEYNNTFDSDRATGQRAAGASSVVMSWTGAYDKFAYVAVNLITGGNRLWHTEPSPWADIGDLNTEILPDSVGMSDSVVLVHGYATPKYWDGTTLASLTADIGQTVPPGAKHAIFHLGSLWVWNTNPSTTSLDGPSSLRMSDANDYDSWPNANQTFVSKDDGQVGMGMLSFTIVETGIAPTATLLLFKNYSAYQITGVFGGSTFSVQRIKSDMGNIAPRTAQFVSGFGAIRLTHKGFALYNGVEDRLISEEIRPAIFGGGDFTGIDFSTVDRAWAAQSQNPTLYVAAVPVDGIALTRLFIYDLIRRGWTTCTLPYDISCLNIFFTRVDHPVLHAGTATGGKIVEVFNANSTDDGAAIAWSVATRRFFAGNQMQAAFFRRAHLNIEGPPNSQVNVQPIIDKGERDIQEYYLPDDPDDVVETVLEIPLMETAHSVQVLINAEGNHRIRGLEIHASTKPLVGYTGRK